MQIYVLSVHCSYCFCLSRLTVDGVTAPVKGHYSTDKDEVEAMRWCNYKSSSQTLNNRKIFSGNITQIWVLCYFHVLIWKLLILAGAIFKLSNISTPAKHRHLPYFHDHKAHLNVSNFLQNVWRAL